MATISPNQASVSVSVPVPTPVQQPRRHQPVSFGSEDENDPYALNQTPQIPRSKRQLNAVILPWSPPAQMRMKRKLPKRSIKFSNHIRK